MTISVRKQMKTWVEQKAAYDDVQYVLRAIALLHTAKVDSKIQFILLQESGKIHQAME